ncbi:MAG TPA: hypothetical protein VFT81_03795 [Dermatophilaceae bacterium]|nr:hypothetical protein [Dermatophilaceae bacterium]
MADSTGMSACPSPVRRLVTGMVGLAVLALAACSPAAADMTPVTVTVYPTATETSQEPTPIPTEYAGATYTPSPASGVSGGHLNGAPADYAEAVGRVGSAPTSDSVQGFFVSPTGNIFCNLVEDGSVMACELAEGRVKAPGTCPVDGPQLVRRLELSADGVVPACSGSIREGDAPRLRYGQRTVVAGTPIQCLSEKVGVTCVDTAGHRGFFLAKGTFATF